MAKRAVRLPACWLLVSLVLFVLGTASAFAQPRGEEKRYDDPPEGGGVYYLEDRHYGDDLIDYDSEPPYDRYERHWRHQARDYRRARDRYGRSYRSRYHRYDRPGWRYYDDGWHDYYDYAGGAFDNGYWEGRRDGRRYAEWERRHELGRRSYADAMSDGVLAFRNGEYADAVRNFIRAAKVNQGDPASRLHATHAMVAIGRYHEALPALRRAFQLQPKIAYLALDIRRDYGVRADFDAHLKELRRAAANAKEDPALWLLLGYYQFYSGRGGGALKSLAKADALAPGDFMTEALLDAARLVTPTPKHRPKAKPGEKDKRKQKPKPKPKPEPEGKAKAKSTQDA